MSKPLNDKENSFKINMPDVKDIPGEENFRAEDIEPVGSDVTIASDDEEGVGIFDDEEDWPDVKEDADAEQLSPTQKEALEQTGSEEDRDVFLAKVDDADDDGIWLNEKNEEDDLDIPGAELDDDDENIGEEDEENNGYSLSDNQ